MLTLTMNASTHLAIHALATTYRMGDRMVRGLIAVFVMCLLPMIYGAAVGIVIDHPQDKHTSQASEWFFQENAANNALRGKTIKAFADGALNGRQVKRVWASGARLVVEATDGSAFVLDFKPAVKVLPVDSVTIETTDGTRFEYSPEVIDKAELLPRGKLVR